MRRRCKHENAVVRYGECTYDAHGFIVYEVEFRECLDCGEWQPMGPAASADGAELAAAHIAAVWRDQNYRPGADRFDWCPSTQSDALCPPCESHFLAHAIVEHTEEGLTSVSTGDKVNHGKP